MTVVQCYAHTANTEDVIKDDFYNQITMTIHNVTKRKIVIFTGNG